MTDLENADFKFLEIFYAGSERTKIHTYIHGLPISSFFFLLLELWNN